MSVLRKPFEHEWLDWFWGLDEETRDRVEAALAEAGARRRAEREAVDRAVAFHRWDADVADVPLPDEK